MTGCPMSNMQNDDDTGFGGIVHGNHSSLTYNSYLMVDQLKELQVCQSDPAHHDEPLFIIIHQTYELWFKLIIHELDLVIDLMRQDKPRRANHFMKRAVAIMRILVQQIHILETMSPRDFLAFRHKLNPASGFQSSQFREIEFLGGLKDLRLLEHFKGDASAYANLTRRYHEPSLQDVFYDLLVRHGFDLPRLNPQQEKDSPDLASTYEETRIQSLTRLYDDESKDSHDMHDLHDLAESFIDFDELIGLWRVNHVTVVERIIGFWRGTGGSEGVGYLRSTLHKKCFADLWNLRSALK